MKDNKEKKSPIYFGVPKKTCPIFFEGEEHSGGIKGTEAGRGQELSVSDGTTEKICLMAENMNEPERVAQQTDTIDENHRKKNVIKPLHFFGKEAEENICNEKERQKPQPSVTSEIIKATTPETTGALVEEITKNYEIRAVRVERYIDKDGKLLTERSNLTVQIVVCSRGIVTVNESFSILWKDVENITKIISRKFPSAILYDKKAAKDVENAFRETITEAQEVCCYVDYGWQIINGLHIYLHKNIDTIAGKILTRMALPVNREIRAGECFEIWKRSISLYKVPGVMAVLSVYSFLGVTYKLFDEAGFAPRFLLFITGKTGSLKTAIAKVLYTQVELERQRKYPRRLDSDTEVSLERGLVMNGRDTTVLIDDFSPAQNKSKEINLEKKLEMLVRMVGDGSSKSRSNVNLEDCRGEGMKGMVVLTGELRGKGLSSNLRCLYCEIEKCFVDNEVLTWMQENESSYATLLQHFIYFLSESWAEVVDYIKASYNPFRKEAAKALSVNRYVDSLVTLWIMADIIREFFASYCRVQDCADIISGLKSEMLSVLWINESQSCDDEPAITYMRAIATMIENQRLLIKETKFEEVDLKTYDGYKQGDYLYLLPDISYQKVTGWLRAGGIHFSLSAKDIAAVLCREEYAVSSPNGVGKRTNYARILVGKDPKKKFLKIKLAALEEISRDE